MAEVADADVSKSELEAGLSLLNMMRRPSDAEDAEGAEDDRSTIATPSSKSKKRTAGSGATGGSAAKKPRKSILLAAAQRVEPKDKEAEEEDSEAEDDAEEEEDDGSLRSLFKRNAQLSTLSHELSLDELREHFGKPIVEVAKEFGICTTFLKKICRRCGIKRWPHRQIRSLTRTIEMLRQAEANATSMQEKIKYQAQIAHVEAKKNAVIDDPDANGKLERVKKSVLNRSAAAGSKKAASAKPTTVKEPVVQAELLHAVAAAAAAATELPTKLEPVTATEAEATAAAALLYSASPRLVVEFINVSVPAVDLGAMLPATTPTASSSPEATAQGQSQNISPSHRKQLTASKDDSTNRAAGSSSLASFQDLEDSPVKPPMPDKQPASPRGDVAAHAPAAPAAAQVSTLVEAS